jgi:hypothetical protein
MTTSTDIDRLLEQTMSSISAAAAKRDLGGVTALTKRASELEAMKKTLMGIEDRLKTYRAPVAQPPTQKTAEPDSNGSLRELPVEVSQGMINQNLLTLTEHVKRGRIKAGEELLVEAAPSEDRFRTDLVGNGNKLRERGAIARFYRDAGVRAGDIVVLTETAPQRWKLRKAEAGEFKTRMDLLTW